MKKYRLAVALESSWTPGLNSLNQNLNVHLADGNEQRMILGPTLLNIFINDLDDGSAP